MPSTDEKSRLDNFCGFLGNLALLVVSTIVGLAICEGVARVAAPLPLAALLYA